MIEIALLLDEFMVMYSGFWSLVLASCSYQYV